MKCKSNKAFEECTPYQVLSVGCCITMDVGVAPRFFYIVYINFFTSTYNVISSVKPYQSPVRGSTLDVYRLTTLVDPRAVGVEHWSTLDVYRLTTVVVKPYSLLIWYDINNNNNSHTYIIYFSIDCEDREKNIGDSGGCRAFSWKKYSAIEKRWIFVFQGAGSLCFTER